MSRLESGSDMTPDPVLLLLLSLDLDSLALSEGDNWSVQPQGAKLNKSSRKTAASK